QAVFLEAPAPGGVLGDEYGNAVHDRAARGEGLFHIPARRLLAAHRQVVDEDVDLALAQDVCDARFGLGGLVDDLREVVPDAVEGAAATDGQAEFGDVGEADGVVGLGEDGFGEVVTDFALVDVEGRHELDIANVVAAEIDVHEAGDELVG